MLCLQMLTSLGLDEVMEAVDTYCNSASHHRVPVTIREISEEEAEAKLVSWMAYLVARKEVKENCMLYLSSIKMIC